MDTLPPPAFVTFIEQVANGSTTPLEAATLFTNELAHWIVFAFGLGLVSGILLVCLVSWAQVIIYVYKNRSERDVN